MSRSFHRKFSQGAFKGYMREDLFSLLPPVFFEDPISFARREGSKVLKDTRWRIAVIFPLGEQRKIFLKRDRTKNWVEFLKYLFLPTRARKEWFIAHQAQKRHLNVPKPLGWMEREQWGLVSESFYLSEAVGSGVSLIDSVHAGRRFALEELVSSVRRIHQAGLFHRDLHGGNFLWDGQSLFLTDLHRAEIVKAMSLKRRLWNLSYLFHSLRDTWEEKDQERFIDLYFGGEPVSPHQKSVFLRQIRSWMGRLQKRQWRSRTKRCLKESSEFTVQNEKGFHYYHRRDYPLKRVKSAIEEHLRLVREDTSALVKHSPKINVSILGDKGKDICVKQFRNLRVWDILKDRFRLPRGLKSWLGGNGLRARGIASLTSLALVEERDWLGLRESFFITEVSERGRELDRYIFEGLKDFRIRRHFIRGFAEWLASLHQRGLFHRDMKTCNVLITGNGTAWTFHLLDLEDLLLDGKVDGKKLFRNLLHLNTSIPKAISRTDRLRFLKRYTSLNPIIKDEKGFIRQLIKKSKQRGIVYVSPQGVVEENWV